MVDLTCQRGGLQNWYDGGTKMVSKRIGNWPHENLKCSTEYFACCRFRSSCNVVRWTCGYVPCSGVIGFFLEGLPALCVDCRPELGKATWNLFCWMGWYGAISSIAHRISYISLQARRHVARRHGAEISTA